MDAVVFGFGISSLQNTFSTKNFDHARYMYDQLNIISPLFLAATAGTPFFKGKISNWDVRWKVLSASLD
jgi:glutamate--cysteine ligase catalytic subunit